MMMEQATVLIAAPRTLGEKLSKIFTSAGYNVTAVCSSGNEVRRVAFERTPDLLVTTYMLPDTNAQELVRSLYTVKNAIMLVSESEKEWLHALDDNLVCLTYPVKRSALLETADVLTQGGARIWPVPPVKAEKVRSEQDQKVINQAKERLQNWYDMTEEQAHRRLQTWSMNSGKRMSEVARIILEEI
ncbi:MAG: ANTAR domain-containing response regulator [Bacillota bacterium]